MPTIGLIGVLVAFAGVAVSIVCLVAGALLSRKKSGGAGETLTWGGHVAVLVTLAALTVCCGVLVYCFMTGDTSIEYVAGSWILWRCSFRSWCWRRSWA